MDFPINDDVNERIISGSDLEKMLLEQDLFSSEDIKKIFESNSYNDDFLRGFLLNDELYSLDNEEGHKKR